MSRREEEKQKIKACAGGAFVELDESKLDKGQLYMLGSQQTLEYWIALLQEKADQASGTDCPSPYVRTTLLQVIEGMQSARDDVAVQLTRSAIKSGAGSIHNVNGLKLQ